MDNDCLLCIFHHLTVINIKPILSVCKQFNSISSSELIWKQLFAKKFDKIVVHNNYKLKYRQFSYLDNFLIKSDQKK